MLLSQLSAGGAAGRDRLPRLRQPRGRRRARCSSASPASAATATTTPPRRSRAAPSRSSSSGRSASACPSSSSTRCARRWRRSRCASTATRARRCASSASPAPTARRRPRSSSRRCSAPAGEQCALLGTVKSVIGGRERAGDPHDARGDRPAGELPRDGRCRRPRLRDRGLLARARARTAPTARTSPPRIFTNLTQDHLDFHATMEDYFAAKRRLFDGDVGVRVINVDDPYGRRLAREHPDAVTFALDAPADYRARELRSRSPARASSRHARGRASSCARACRGASTSPTCSARSPPRTGSASRSTTIAAALPDVAPAPGRFQALDEGQPFTRPRRLRPHAGLARERAARRARRSTDGPADRGVRLRRRPRPRQAPADGADLRGARRPHDRDLRQPALGGPAAIIEEILAGRRAAAATVEAIDDRREAIARAIALAGDGDVVVIAGKGHERGQQFANGRTIPFDDAGGRRATRCGRAREGLGRSAARRRGGGARCCAAAPAPRPAGPRRVDRLARARARRALRRARRASTPTAGASPAPRSPPAPGGCSSAPEHAEARRPPPAAAPCSSPSDPLAALHALARAWRRELGAPRRRDHRLDRQDLDQGHPRRAARAARFAPSRARATTTPRSACRCTILGAPGGTRGPGARARDARRRPDRRADGDLRARRRRDRQRRARAPRAARVARGDRRRQGRADRRAARRGERRRARRRAAARAVPAR